jgi:Na+-transporting NADH:ubiquinone oxidoreductase subunit NqrB
MGTAFLAGWLAGAVHVLSGVDHLAALAPLSVEAGRRAWRAGLRWGLGHSSGVLIVGAAALLLRGALDLDSISGWGERIVGIVLVALGLWGLRRLSRNRLHSHTHDHAGRAHVHFHVHGAEAAHESTQAHLHSHAAFAVGTLHGIAGTSHLFGLLPALALPTPGATWSYLAGFGAGTIAAMTLFAGILGWATPRRSAEGLRAYRGLLAIASSLTLLVGLGWILLPFLGIPLS